MPVTIYKVRPPTVEATQYDGTALSRNEIIEFVGTVSTDRARIEDRADNVYLVRYGIDYPVLPTDFVVKHGEGENAEFYVVPANRFNELYSVL